MAHYEADGPVGDRDLKVSLLSTDALADEHTVRIKPHREARSKSVAEKPDFIKAPHNGLSSEEASRRLREFGQNVLPEKVVPEWKKFGRLLIDPMPIMIWIAAVVEFAIENALDGCILVGINLINAGISYYEENKAGNAIAALKASLKPFAIVKRDGMWIENFDSRNLVPGDLIQLNMGKAVPADCWINEKEVEIDQSAMTGESLPVTMYEGDIAKMGSNVMRGEVEGTVQATGAATFFGKTAAMLGGDDEKSNLQKLLERIMVILSVMCFAAAGAVFVVLLANGEKFKDALETTVVLIVASIPMAMEIVCNTTLAVGSGEMLQYGAIVSRLNAIEDMAGMNMLCSDKTGTLTKNKMELQDDTPVFQPGVTRAQLLLMAAMAAKWHESPKDALDTLVLGPGGADLAQLEAMEQLDYMPFDPKVKRTEGSIRDRRTGETFRVAKGAPHVIVELDQDTSIHDQVMDKVSLLADDGVRSLAVAKTDANGNWRFQGMLTFLDPPRDDTKQTIELSNQYGIPVKMITGDHLKIAIKTAKDLGMKNAQHIVGPSELPLLNADGSTPENLLEYKDIIGGAAGFAQVFPEHKFLIVECYRQMNYKVGMTGDGVNDAPALKRADVGVAVNGATDAAKAAADIVLTNDGLSAIIVGVEISRKIFQRMKNFVIYRIAATLQLLFFFFFAVIWMRPKTYYPIVVPGMDDLPDFFHMPVLMLMIITMLNDGTLIAIGYDNVVPSKRPEVWNLRVLFTVAGMLAFVAMISSLCLLQMCLNSHNPESLLFKMGLPVTYSHTIMIVYLKVSVSDFLTLFSCRTNENFFWTTAPSKILFFAACASLFISSMLASYWPDAMLDGIHVYGLSKAEAGKGDANAALALYVWLYCLVWWLIQDVAKVGTYWVLKRWNLFDILEKAALGDPMDQKGAMRSVSVADDMFTANDDRRMVRKASELMFEDHKKPAEVAAIKRRLSISAQKRK